VFQVSAAVNLLENCESSKRPRAALAAGQIAAGDFTTALASAMGAERAFGVERGPKKLLVAQVDKACSIQVAVPFERKSKMSCITLFQITASVSRCFLFFAANKEA